MFDVGFSELCMLGLVTLLVVGPEKLPQVARVAGFWLGKARAFAASAKAELKEELQAEEMRQLLREQDQSLRHFQQELGERLDAVQPARPAESSGDRTARAADFPGE